MPGAAATVDELSAIYLQMTKIEVKKSDLEDRVAKMMDKHANDPGESVSTMNEKIHDCLAKSDGKEHELENVTSEVDKQQGDGQGEFHKHGWRHRE